MPTRKLLYRGPSKNGLYPLAGSTLPQHHTSFFSTQSTKPVSSKTWHDRLGHPNSKVLHSLLPHLHTNCSNKTESVHCTHCIQGKMTQLPFQKSVPKACKPLEVIHSDV